MTNVDLRIFDPTRVRRLFEEKEERIATLARDNSSLRTVNADLLEALQAAMPFIDDACDVHSVFPERAASSECRAVVEAARAAIAKAL